MIPLAMPASASASPGGLWTPSEITTALWLDAADDSTITESGGAVSEWADKSGDARDADQDAGSKQPLTGSYTIGGLNTLSFDGSADVLEVQDKPDVTAEGISIWTIGYFADDKEFIGIYDTTQNARVWRLSRRRFSMQETGSAYDSSTEAEMADPGSSAGIIYGEWEGGGAPKFFRNGVLEATASNTVTDVDSTSANLLIGAGTANYYALCNLAEIIIRIGATDATNRQKMEGYLAHKWGLTANLPADHPYKSAAPTV